MTNLKMVEEKANELGRDLLEVEKALKSIQSRKCRLKKQSGRFDFNEKMAEVLQEEELLKSVRQLLNPKEKTVTTYEQEDVDKLDYDETVKALKSIQSKKTLTRWLTTEDGNNDEYRNACRIEKMLQAHRDNIKPVEDAYVRKTDLTTIIDTIKETNDISRETIIELLESLM